MSLRIENTARRGRRAYYVQVPHQFLRDRDTNIIWLAQIHISPTPQKKS